MNKKDLTLVILAAGMGSRFGGLKQIEPMGPNGEFMIDYSVYDAIEAGFTKIVFLIKKENYDVFKETIGRRVEPHIEVSYAFQTNDELLDKYPVLKDREKPLGTAHALLCCRDEVTTPFAMINADDFYGRDAFVKASEFLREDNLEKDKEHYGMISYLVKNTITKNGAVKRGVCKTTDGYLDKIIESSVERIEGKIIAKPLDGSASFEVDDNASVSMNLLLFTPSIFGYIEQHMDEFFTKHQQDILTCEYLIPDVLSMAIREEYANAKVIPTTSTWYGVTYKEDAPVVKSALKKLVEEKEYPQDLWK